ncbi:TonB-dependent receptor domain-containing protein [Sphingomonas sp. S2-65]|uniref:TonB-dependent receptor domain-containing protein n=1 Tax=Sphingomonas sp. S2-65 TaxID=2903960 RepID=UPI001F20F7E6|nr:TonB-dependent receptor [Sphingomonas sp. S2-65]UYY57637.1 TonB-dependent receptor [Sphingomonas sp. S2-65]
MNQTQITHGLRCGTALSALVLATALSVSPAFAQDTTTTAEPQTTVAPLEAVQDQAAETGNEVVVTGTLIRNPNLTSSSPVNVIGQEELTLRQSNVAEEVLRSLPGVVPSIGSSVNNGNGGSSFVDLRGLGPQRNLVLLNGSRLVPADFNGQVNLNVIPLALLERVDVLTGGATTTYGADAVSGVVNFITRKDFSGVELNASEQITERGDGNVFRADLTMGANLEDGRGNVTVSLGYQKAKPVYQGDRDISIFQVDSVSGDQAGSGTTVPIRMNLGNGLGTRQLDPATGALVPTYAFFNFNPYNVFQTPFERYSLFVNGRYELADGIEAYSEGLFSKTKVSTVIAPSGTFGLTFAIPFSNPYLPTAIRNEALAQRAAQCAGTGVNCAPVTATDTFSAALSRRFVEGGSRISEYTTQLFQGRVGVRGDLSEHLSFDVSGSYGESENTSRSTGQGLASRVQAALLASNTTSCFNGDPACVPLNLFGAAGSITPAQFAYLNIPTTSATKTSLGAARAVLSGDFGLVSPGATDAVGFAVGAEYRRYTAESTSDLSSQTPDEVLGAGAANPDSRGEYNVKEAFAELIAPLIQNRPFFHNLTLELGARYSDYSTAGTNWTWKAGGNWEPTDWLKVRGNYQKAARAPNISELFSPQITGLDNFASDPCQGSAPTTNAQLRAICIAQGAPASSIGNIEAEPSAQPNNRSGGNLNLGVEKATTWTAGLVINPDFVPGLTISADYYNIKVDDAISQPSFGDALNACFLEANNPGLSATNPACTAIRRNPATGGLFGTAAAFVPLPYSNSGRIRTDGVDLTVNYRRDIGFAKLDLNFSGNWTNSSRFQATPASVERECVGYYSNSCGSPGAGINFRGSIQPKWSFNQRTTLGFGGIDLSLLWRYVDKMDYEPLAVQELLGDNNADTDPPAEQFRHIKAAHYFDLATRFAATDNFDLTVTVTNLFDRDPPLVGNTIGSTSFNSGNTYPSTYDALGRRFAFGAKLKF